MYWWIPEKKSVPCFQSFRVSRCTLRSFQHLYFQELCYRVSKWLFVENQINLQINQGGKGTDSLCTAGLQTISYKVGHGAPCLGFWSENSRRSHGRKGMICAKKVQDIDVSRGRKKTTLRCWSLSILPTWTVQEVVVKQLFHTTLKEVSTVFRWKNRSSWDICQSWK